MNNLLDVLPEGGRRIGIGEALADGLIGFAVVFLGIAILVAVLTIVGIIMKRTQGKKSSVKNVAPVQNVNKSVETHQDEDEDELIAVITAAIAACYQAEGRKCDFKVQRIKRI